MEGGDLSESVVILLILNRKNDFCILCVLLFFPLLVLIFGLGLSLAVLVHATSLLARRFFLSESKCVGKLVSRS
jgi:hypothetical protein